MSESWHRRRTALIARSHGDFGFYDSAYQIAVLPQQAVVPHVVVDHEMTHVSLVLNSSIGALERMLVWLEWTATTTGNAEAVTRVQALSAEILSATEIVHEAAAWFGTELQTDGHENLKAPAAYAREVDKLRRAFDRMPQRPMARLSDDPAPILDIADSVAIYALSPPCMRTLWLQPERLSVEWLRAAFKDKDNNFLARFTALCSQLATIPFSEAFAWAHAIAIEWRGVRPDSEKATRAVPVRSKPLLFFRRRAIPASFRSELYELGMAKVLGALAKTIGVLAPPLDEGAILEEFASFEVTHGFQTELDRYSQVCVIENSSPWRELTYDDPHVAAMVLDTSSFLTVSVTRGASAATFTRAPERVTHAILTGPHRGVDADGQSLRPTWYADFDSAASFLPAFVRHGHHVLASSVGYDFGVGDYSGVTLLKDLPHVVVAIRDLRSLWLALGRNGLRGCRTIEWLPQPSPSGRKHFGFLLFKPADNDFPIVVNPTVVSHYERAVAVADRWPAATGVRLVAHPQGKPYEWLGPMTDAVMTAAAVFELGSDANAVFNSALLFDTRKNEGRGKREST